MDTMDGKNPDHLPKRYVDGGDGSKAEAVLGRVFEHMREVPDLGRERVCRALELPPPGARPVRRRWWLLGVLPAGAAAAAAVLVTAWPGGEEQIPTASSGRLFLAAGGVQASSAGGALRPAGNGQLLAAGARVSTPSGGRAVVHFDSAAVVVFAERTTAVVARAEDADGIDLVFGDILASVPKKAEGGSFFVRAGGYEVRVVGTVFGVRADERGVVEVQVEEGVVDVAGAAVRARVTAGRCWSSEQGLGERCRPAAASPSPEAAHAEPPPAAAPLAGSAPSKVVTASPRRVRRVATSGPSRSAKLGASAGVLSVESLAGGPAETPAPDAPAVETAVAQAPSTGTAPAAATTAVSSSRAVQEALLYAQAVALRGEGRYRAAVRAFGLVAAAWGRHEEAALYEMGRIQQRHLADSASALTSLEECRRRFPMGALREQVDVAVIECLVADKSVTRALAEIDRFVRERPASLHRAHVERLRAQVQTAR